MSVPLVVEVTESIITAPLSTAPPKPASAPILTLIDERVATGPLDYMIEFPSDSESYGYIILVEDSNTRSYIPVVGVYTSLH